jgi:hypothetical protein
MATRRSRRSNRLEKPTQTVAVSTHRRLKRQRWQIPDDGKREWGGERIHIPQPEDLTPAEF